MNIETIRSPQGFDQAIIAMRNPMESHGKSDSYWTVNEDGYLDKYIIGEKDKDLSIRLQKAGAEHCKHLRMIFVWADITAPLYWLKQLDTYRIGVEKVSYSTMHKLMARPLMKDDFEHDSLNDKYFNTLLDYLNGSIESYHLCEDPDHKQEIWRGIIQALPECYLQKRTYCFSYAALRNIIKQREGHKLVEWEQFIKWCRSLPEGWMLFDDLS